MGQYSCEEAVKLLRDIVAIPSYSFHEDERADFLCRFFASKGISFSRKKNNIILGTVTDASLPTLMLNSHIDTVKESDSYTFDPFRPEISDSIVRGLGSNDAGGCVVSLIETFLHFYGEKLPFNIFLILTAEEERSGANGIDLLAGQINSDIDFAIIGEPTGMRAAIGERGLIVIDAQAKGKSGHAARKDGINAIDIAIEDILKLKQYDWMTVTQIEAGSQHNVIPDKCNFVIDVRTTERHSNIEVFNMLQGMLKSELKARSLTNKSSATPKDGILMKAICECGIEQYSSPTTSDWMRINVPAVKMGPGDSRRSHKADEYITVREIENGINGYIGFVGKLSEIIKENNGYTR